MNPELVKIIIEGFKLIFAVLKEIVEYLDDKQYEQQRDFFPIRDKLEELRKFVQEGPELEDGNDENV